MVFLFGGLLKIAVMSEENCLICEPVIGRFLSENAFDGNVGNLFRNRHSTFALAASQNFFLFEKLLQLIMCSLHVKRNWQAESTIVRKLTKQEAHIIQILTFKLHLITRTAESKETKSEIVHAWVVDGHIRCTTKKPWSRNGLEDFQLFPL